MREVYHQLLSDVSGVDACPDLQSTRNQKAVPT